MRMILEQNLSKPIPGVMDKDILMAEPKYDGVMFKINTMNKTGRTKDAKLYPDISHILPNINPYLNSINPIIKYQYVELVCVDENDMPTRDRSKVMIVIRKQKDWELYAPRIRAYLFNVEFQEVHKQLKYNNTLLTIREVKAILTNDQYFTHPSFRKVPRVTTTIDKVLFAKREFQKYHTGLLEGLVLTKLNALHHQFYDKPPAMCKDVFKLKQAFDASLRIVGKTPHSKNPEWIGTYICETADGQLRVPIGMGLTGEMRKQPISEVLGKIVDVRYEALIPKTKSFVSARVLGFREDDTVDTYEKLLERSE